MKLQTMPNQLQRKDIVDLFYWIQRLYRVNIKTILLNSHRETWYENLAVFSRAELINGFRNLIELKQQTVTDKILFFPVSVKNFLKLCLEED